MTDALETTCRSIAGGMELARTYEVRLEVIRQMCRHQQAQGIRHAQKHFDLNFTTIMGFHEWCETTATALEKEEL